MRDGLQESMSAINEFVSGGSIENRTNLLSQPLNVCKFTAGRPTPVAERIRRESVFTQQIVKRLGSGNTSPTSTHTRGEVLTRSVANDAPAT